MNPFSSGERFDAGSQENRKDSADTPTSVDETPIKNEKRETPRQRSKSWHFALREPTGNSGTDNEIQLEQV